MIFDWLARKKLGECSSEYNGTIEVFSEMGEKFVLVNGVEQSGFLVRKIWEKALSSFWPGPESSRKNDAGGAQHDKRVLILGLGCGSVIKPLRREFPNCEITGVEIDPQMIKIGEKYFGMGKIPNLKIICADAKDFVYRNKERFDLVLVDTYLGKSYQDSVAEFSRILNFQGVLLVNRIRGRRNVVEASVLRTSLKTDSKLVAMNLRVSG